MSHLLILSVLYFHFFSLPTMLVLSFMFHTTLLKKWRPARFNIILISVHTFARWNSKQESNYEMRVYAGVTRRYWTLSSSFFFIYNFLPPLPVSTWWTQRLPFAHSTHIDFEDLKKREPLLYCTELVSLPPSLMRSYIMPIIDTSGDQDIGSPHYSLSFPLLAWTTADPHQACVLATGPRPYKRQRTIGSLS